MSWLHTLIFGAALGGSAIKAHVKNVELREDLFYLWNGVPYYYDTTGHTHLTNGELIHISIDGRIVRDRRNRVIYNKDDDDNKKLISEVMKSDNQFKYARVYHKKSMYPVTKNLMTGEYISRIGVIEKTGMPNQYRKWRWNDTNYYSSGKEIWKDDEGIIITKEEFDAIRWCKAVRPSSIVVMEVDKHGYVGYIGL